MALTKAHNRMISGPIFDVNDFGAVGDGITDDTSSVQAAIDAAGASGGVVQFRTQSYALNTVNLIGLSNVVLQGNGASVAKVSGSGSNTLIFQIKGGCENITIEGFADIDGGYDSTNSTTGSNPVILIGDQSGGGDGGATNKNIRVLNNNIRRSNWGGVVVYGRSDNTGAITPLNENIFISQNVFSDCAGSAVFVYKNAKMVIVSENSIDTMAFNGITFDTMAASDTVTSEPIDAVTIANNRIINFGKTGQGSGILVKGAVSNVSISGNAVSSGLVQPSGSFVNYGILVNKDAAGNGASNVTVTGNVIKNIKSSLVGLGLVVGAETRRVTVSGNTVFDCTGAGVQVLDGVLECSVTGNVVEQAGNATYGYRFEGLSSSKIVDLVVSGNIFKKSSSTAVGGFRFDYITNLTQEANIAPDFTSTSASVTNSTFVRSLRQFSATAIPTSGTYAQGDIVVNPTTTTINPVDCWRCIVAGTPGTWRPVSWMVGKAPTASRPTLTASDIGVTYLDTTLDPDGKPIWWNGIAWVDATGTTV